MVGVLVAVGVAVGVCVGVLGIWLKLAITVLLSSIFIEITGFVPEASPVQKLKT
jgi:hypothetical protein